MQLMKQVLYLLATTAGLSLMTKLYFNVLFQDLQVYSILKTINISPNKKDYGELHWLNSEWENQQTAAPT